MRTDFEHLFTCKSGICAVSMPGMLLFEKATNAMLQESDRRSSKNATSFMTKDLSIIAQNKRAVGASSLVGAKGEALAAEFLETNGYRNIVANFKVPVGRNSNGAEVTGEIDIIALDGDTLCFVEVKTRMSNDFAEPSAAVTLRKQRQITRTANVYRRIFELTEMRYRYDVVSIVLGHFGEPSIDLLKGFWKDQKFVKRSSNHEIW